MRFGIDLSEHNGNVDMSKVKASGIDFAILRMAYGKNKTQIDLNDTYLFRITTIYILRLAFTYIRMLFLRKMLCRRQN